MEYEIGPNESISTAVVRAVSAVEGRDPRSLRPLADVLEPAALDSLFGSPGEEFSRPGARLRFVYSKCWVTVDNGEYLTLEPFESEIRNERQGVTDNDVR
ncbi:HalOD1 output domain-containing protein [Natronomonas gomsonensis]|uniref:HalOD1 output domain-containing protein n=1 Tax=Natronomonas gomsonensis TaxID=1046043 RepID=UPI0015B88D61|nr:HalOD1 output domain-containing protein [Natronomonas gomsonensis]